MAFKFDSSFLERLRLRGQSIEDLANFEKEFLKKLSSAGADFQIKLRQLWEMAKKSTTPRTRWLCLGALVYFLNPFDFIPDFLIPFGFVDDAAVVAMVIKALKNDFEKM